MDYEEWQVGKIKGELKKEMNVDHKKEPRLEIKEERLRASELEKRKK